MPNEKELEAARIAVLLNLAHCGLKLNQWNMAAGAAAQALVFDQSNAKGWFRLATAQVNSKDYDGADLSIARCREHGVPQQDVDDLTARSAAGRAILGQEERRKFKKMFA